MARRLSYDEHRRWLDLSRTIIPQAYQSDGPARTPVRPSSRVRSLRAGQSRRAQQEQEAIRRLSAGVGRPGRFADLAQRVTTGGGPGDFARDEPSMSSREQARFDREQARAWRDREVAESRRRGVPSLSSMRPVRYFDEFAPASGSSPAEHSRRTSRAAYVAPTEITVGGKRYYSVDDALAAATRVGNREQHRRDVFRHLAGAGFSADDIDKVQKSTFIGDTIRGLYEGRRKALFDQQKRLDDWYTEGSKGFRSKADVVGDALKKRLSLAGNLPARQSDSRLNAIFPAIAAGKDIGVAVAAANARRGGSYSRGGASGGAAEYSSSIVRDIASNGLKGHEAGWARGSSGGVWIGDRSGGGSPAGSAGKAVSSILAAVHGAYPGGEFQDALPNGRLRFTRDTRGQGMGLGAGFHSARETDWNNALTDVNNWASKVYGDYLVSKKGYAERQQQLAMDKLKAAEQSVINRQLKSLAWLAERGYGVPATQEAQPSQNPAPSGNPVQTASPVVVGGVEPSPGPTEEPIVGPDGVLRDPNTDEVVG